jgi:hypothetical protein
MSITNGKESRAVQGHPVKALIVVSIRESEIRSLQSVSMISGREAVHVIRGPWSAQNREVVTVVTEAQCLDTTFKSLERAAQEGAGFYAVAIPIGDRGFDSKHIECWSGGLDHQVHAVGIDCDDDALPWHLRVVRDEARALARWNRGWAATALLAVANSQPDAAVEGPAFVGGGA